MLKIEDLLAIRNKKQIKYNEIDRKCFYNLNKLNQKNGNGRVYGTTYEIIKALNEHGLYNKKAHELITEYYKSVGELEAINELIETTKKDL